MYISLTPDKGKNEYFIYPFVRPLPSPAPVPFCN